MRGIWFVALAGCGPGLEISLAESHAPIRNGTPSTEAAVVALQRVPEYDLGSCSGTLVAPSVVLTAAHCVDGDVSPIDNAQIYFGAVQDGTGEVRSIARVNIHPDFETFDYTNDIAFVELSSPAPAEITPIPFLPPELGLEPEDACGVVRLVGYGRNETGAHGTRLEHEQSILVVCGRGQPCEVQGTTTQPGTFSFLYDSGGTCSGDSGGAALIDRDGVTYLAGVTSTSELTTDNCMWARFGAETIVDLHASRIEDFIAGEDVGYEPVTRPTTICNDCEVGTACTLAGGECGGTCYEGDTQSYPDGYCTYDCLTDDDCHPDAVCLRGFLDVGTCFRACDTSTECRSGYSCQDWGASRRICLTAPGAGTAEVGELCATNQDCDAGFCNPINFDWTEGICYATCIGEDTCPSGGCHGGYCYRECTTVADCGSDELTCWPFTPGAALGYCWSECLNDFDCGDENCNEYGLCGDLVPPAMSAVAPLVCEEPPPDAEDDPGSDENDGPPRPHSIRAEPDGCAAAAPSLWLLVLLGARRRLR